MPIRNSVSSAAASVADNVIPKPRHTDLRGSVDPASNAYDGSLADNVGIDQEHARSVLMGIANANPLGLETPNDLPVRDVLSFVRMPNNLGFGVETRYRQRVRSPLTGIRGHCVVTCQSGSAKAVAECNMMSCPLWAMRLGKNAHYGKRSKST